MVARLPAICLRVEGVAVFVAAVALYFAEGHPWWLFVVLALAPDVGMIGYGAGPRVGAITYDALHLEAVPLALGVGGVLAESDLAIGVALIWLAHIGVDRALGYGLKYPTRFQDTHLQRV